LQFKIEIFDWLEPIAQNFLFQCRAVQDKVIIKLKETLDPNKIGHIPQATYLEHDFKSPNRFHIGRAH